MLSDARDAVLSRHPHLIVTTALHTSGPVPALLEESATALLVTVGAHGRGGASALLIGSCVVAVAEHARCPVAVVRGRHDDSAPPTDGPVVMGVDGSPTSDSAVAAAFDEASWRRTGLTAVHAWSESLVHLPGAHGGRGAAETAEQEVLAERLAGWQEKYPDVAVRRVVDRSNPVLSLLEHGRLAQLLVVGSRGRAMWTHAAVAGPGPGRTSPGAPDVRTKVGVPAGLAAVDQRRRAGQGRAMPGSRACGVEESR